MVNADMHGRLLVPHNWIGRVSVGACRNYTGTFREGPPAEGISFSAESMVGLRR